jgi:hypothetical protein
MLIQLPHDVPVTHLRHSLTRCDFRKAHTWPRGGCDRQREIILTAVHEARDSHRIGNNWNRCTRALLILSLVLTRLAIVALARQVLFCARQR